MNENTFSVSSLRRNTMRVSSHLFYLFDPDFHAGLYLLYGLCAAGSCHVVRRALQYLQVKGVALFQGNLKAKLCCVALFATIMQVYVMFKLCLFIYVNLTYYVFNLVFGNMVLLLVTLSVPYLFLKALLCSNQHRHKAFQWRYEVLFDDQGLRTCPVSPAVVHLPQCGNEDLRKQLLHTF